MRTNFTKGWLGLAASALVCSSLQAAVLYNANIPRLDPAPNHPDPYYYNPGPDNNGASRIVFDDVPVSTLATPNATALVTRVSFDVLRLASAPTVTVTAYAAQLRPDNLANGGPNDLPFWGDPGPETQIGQTVLGPNGSTTNRTTVVFGDGVSTLFNTGILNTSPANGVSNNGFGYFVVGLRFSTVTDSQGWTIAYPGPVVPSGPGANDVDIAANGNMDVYWDYGSQADFGEFTYSSDTAGQNIAGAQFFEVEGTLVPEPGSLALMGIGALVPLSRRVRNRR
jgi:hypothetical protein